MGRMYTRLTFIMLVIAAWAMHDDAVGQSLSAGDIAFVQYNADGTDDFAFVALTDIPGSEVIFFTDNEENDLGGGEGTITWTAPSGGVTCGTVVTITTTPSATTGAVVESFDLDFAGSGDAILAYQGSTASPTFLAALSNDGGSWGGSNDGNLPAGLTNGATAIAISPEIDNAKYDASTLNNSQANLLTEINDNTNWIRDDSNNQTFSGTFTVTDCAVTTTTVQFASATSTLAEDGLFIDVCVEIANPDATNATTVQVALDGASTAANGTDYDDGGVPAMAIAFPLTLTFPAGSSSDECLTVYISNDDSLIEGDETVVLNLQNPSGGNSASLGSTTQHTLTISDNDAPATCFTDDCDFEIVPVTQNGEIDNWSCSSGSYTANAFCGSCNEPSDLWLIYGELDLSAVTGSDVLDLILDATEGFSGSDLEVFYSTSYTGCPDDSGNNWVSVGTITASGNNQTFDLTGAAGSGAVYIGIQYYTATGAAGATSEWSIENITIESTACPTTNTPISSLCTPDEPCASSGNTTYDTGVTLVNLNTINNSTGKPAGYTDYTSTSTDLTLGESYDLTVNVNTDGLYTVASKVWIDWNQNNLFNDAGEEYDLGNANNVSNGSTSNSPLSISVPVGATLGSTVMRVSAKYSTAAGPCDTGYDGEVEDYTINVVCTPSTQASNPAVSNAKYTNLDVSWTRGSGSGVVVLAKEGSAVDADPVDGNSYTGASKFGTGDQIGSGNYVVYVGSGTGLTVTGLVNNTNYHFAVYEYTAADYCYLTPGATASGTTLAAPTSDAIRINEVDSDTPGSDDAEFVELYSEGSAGFDLENLVVVFFNGGDDASLEAFDLDGEVTDLAGFLLLGGTNAPMSPEISFSNGALQNGPDAVALYAGDAGDFTNDTPVTTTNLIDALVYGSGADDTGLLNGLGETTQVDEDENGNSENESIQRGSWFVAAPTPRGANLPVSLLNLTAKVQDQSTLLQWSTATESGNSHFDIERSVDERTFTQIGRVAGAGDSAEQIDYTFTDTKPAPGVNYYRLRQVDFAGTYEYFGPVAVRFGGEVGEQPVRVWPVPARETLQVELLGEADSEWQLQVVDLNGRTLLQRQYQDKSLNTSLPIAELPAGAYFLRWRNGPRTGQTRFVKQ